MRTDVLIKINTLVDEAFHSMHVSPYKAGVFSVFKNPTEKEWREVFKHEGAVYHGDTASVPTARAITVGKDRFVWPANAGLHNDVKRMLGMAKLTHQGLVIHHEEWEKHPGKRIETATRRGLEAPMESVRGMNDARGYLHVGHGRGKHVTLWVKRTPTSPVETHKMQTAHQVKTHGEVFGNVSNVFAQGRYEHETGRLSVAVDHRWGAREMPHVAAKTQKQFDTLHAKRLVRSLHRDLLASFPQHTVMHVEDPDLWK